MANVKEQLAPDEKPGTGKTGRGRYSIENRRLQVRFALRYINDPIALQRSPLCRLSTIEKRALAEYPDGVVSRGRALRDLINECLSEIEQELDGLSGVAKLKLFTSHTREGKGLTQASHSIGVSREHASRTFKRKLIELLTDKMLIKLK